MIVGDRVAVVGTLIDRTTNCYGVQPDNSNKVDYYPVDMVQPYLPSFIEVWQGLQRMVKETGESLDISKYTTIEQMQNDILRWVREHPAEEVEVEEENG